MTNVNNSAAQLDDSQATVQRLVALAIRGLLPMFDEQRKLFCYTRRKTDQGMVRDGLSPRYTMMTLMGLHRVEEAGGVSPIAVKLVLQALLANLDWVTDIGDLGVLLWMCAVVAPDRLAELEGRIELETALVRYRGAKRGVTMELAWFLTGLSNWALARPEKLARLKDLAFKTFAMLKKNRGEQGFFGHVSRSGSLNGLVRGRIGSFADQVYPVYAMTRFFQAYQEESYQEESAIQMALQCGRGLCDAQGSLGQWWWHYDSSTGRVLEGYPVFSVHQHAMGPMTLFALGEAAQCDFSPWIYRGLKWINAKNELQFDMEDDSAQLVWRCQYRPTSQVKTYLKAALIPRNSGAPYEARKDLKVLFECRPYELGWLLYAFASRCGKPRPAPTKAFENFAGVSVSARR
ncbi:MAG: hypothetical protein ABSF15_29450 [Candidatus Sulfotelmatobacter sp.]